MCPRKIVNSCESTTTIMEVLETALMDPPRWFAITAKYHMIPYVYPMMLILNFLVVVILITCGFLHNSMGLLSHSIHMCYNLTLMSVLGVCVYFNWMKTERYQPIFTMTAQKFNVFIGFLMLVHSSAIVGIGIWFIMYQPLIRFYIDAVVILVPSISVNLLNYCIVDYDYNAERVIILPQNMPNKKLIKIAQESMKENEDGYKNVKSFTVHIKAAGIGSILTLCISLVVHLLKLELADSIMSIVNGVLMAGCAVYLMITSLKAILRKKQTEKNLENGLCK